MVSGVPQIQWINDWGVICDDDWGAPSSRILCNELAGFEGIPLYGLAKHVGLPPRSVWVTNVTCSGGEASIYKCPNAGWDKVGSACSTRNYAGVHCFSSGYEEVRLNGQVDKNYNTIVSGVFEVKYNGKSTLPLPLISLYPATIQERGARPVPQPPGTGRQPLLCASSWGWAMGTALWGPTLPNTPGMVSNHGNHAGILLLLTSISVRSHNICCTAAHLA